MNLSGVIYQALDMALQGLTMWLCLQKKRVLSGKVEKGSVFAGVIVAHKRTIVVDNVEETAYLRHPNQHLWPSTNSEL